jgi:hypothetical protein
MTLEQQVVSLELARKLKELGMKQESLFYWLDMRDSNWKSWILDNATPEQLRLFPEQYVSAFTVAELGEINKATAECAWNEQEQEWIVYKENGARLDTANTEADARAKMLIYLLENKLMN